MEKGYEDNALLLEYKTFLYSTYNDELVRLNTNKRALYAKIDALLAEITTLYSTYSDELVRLNTNKRVLHAKIDPLLAEITTLKNGIRMRRGKRVSYNHNPLFGTRVEMAEGLPIKETGIEAGSKGSITGIWAGSKVHLVVRWDIGKTSDNVKEELLIYAH